MIDSADSSTQGVPENLSAPAEGFEVAAHDGYTLSIYMRAKSMYHAIVELLLPYGASLEATVLSRSLFEDSIRLMRLESDGSERAARILGWRNDAITREIHIIAEAAGHNPEDDEFPLIQTALHEERKRLLAYAARNGVGKLRTFRSSDQDAVALGRTEDAWFYKVSHEYVHGGPLAHFSRIALTDDGTRLFSMADTGDTNALVVGFFAGRSMICAFEATASIFGWPMPKALTMLRNELVDDD